VPPPPHSTLFPYTTLFRSLPQGARQFALDNEHYNFFGPRCVKDLRLSRAIISDSNDQLSVQLGFAPSEFKHDQGLVIEYADVIEFDIDVTASPRTTNIWLHSRRLGDLQLDEILPHERGCSHEIRFTGGVIRIV